MAFCNADVRPQVLEESNLSLRVQVLNLKVSAPKSIISIPEYRKPPTYPMFRYFGPLGFVPWGGAWCRVSGMDPEYSTEW